jgi:membrane protein YqaA with SNARE-associated domain
MQEFFEAVVRFFSEYGLQGLFVYSIVETITPLAGAEVFFTLLIANGESWIAVSAVATVANAVGAAIVVLLFGSGDAWLARKILKPADIDRAKAIMAKYGPAAILIFAMTPLPFFVILFVAAFIKMDFRRVIGWTVFSRGLRFFATNYFIFLLTGIDSFLGINKYVWIGIFLLAVTVPILLAMRLMERRVVRSVVGKQDEKVDQRDVDPL